MCDVFLGLSLLLLSQGERRFHKNCSLFVILSRRELRAANRWYHICGMAKIRLVSYNVSLAGLCCDK